MYICSIEWVYLPEETPLLSHRLKKMSFQLDTNFSLSETLFVWQDKENIFACVMS